MRLVTVDGLPVPARDVLRRGLQYALGMHLLTVPPSSGSDDPVHARLDSLLRKVRALTSTTSPKDVALAGPWIPDTIDTDDPATEARIGALERAVCARHPHVDHVVVRLHGDPDEAFETWAESANEKYVTGGGVVKTHVTLEDVHAHAARARHMTSPFEKSTVIDVDCPAFAADTPSIIAGMVDQVVARLARLV